MEYLNDFFAESNKSKQVNLLRKMFIHYDGDNNNVIDRTEFAQFYKDLLTELKVINSKTVLSEAQISDFLQLVDANNDNVVTLKVFFETVFIFLQRNL